MWGLWRWSGLALALVLAVAAVACGGGGGSSASGADAQSILSKSAQKFAAVKYFHFKLEHQNSGFIPIVLGLHLTTAEGDEAVPNKISAEVQAKTGPTTVRVNVIGIDTKTWITNPFTRNWEQAPGNIAISDIVDPAGLVTEVAKSIQQPKVSGVDSVDGVDCYHITGTIASDALTQSLSFADPGRMLAVEAWVGKDDSLPRRARLKGSLVQGEKDDVVREINVSKLDVPVNIQPPQ